MSSPHGAEFQLSALHHAVLVSFKVDQVVLDLAKTSFPFVNLRGMQGRYEFIHLNAFNECIHE